MSFVVMKGFIHSHISYEGRLGAKKRDFSLYFLHLGKRAAQSQSRGETLPHVVDLPAGRRTRLIGKRKPFRGT